MTYTTIAEPILLIIVVLAAGIFLGFFSFMFTFKKESNDLEKNIIKFDKKINKFEDERQSDRPRRVPKY
tara:strand:- start:365 stop:571 length:207 start_codon:yes stop_codon:yes gene_type:complete